MTFKPGWLFAAAALVVLAAAALWLLRKDDFDYEAAFETPPEIGDSGGPRDGAVILAIPAIAGKPREQAEQVLGTPEQCEDSLYSTRCRYARASTEVVYIDGKADWITVSGFHDDWMLDAQTLPALGLPVAEPQSMSQRVGTWRDLAGLKEVNLVGDSHRVQYARIKALTP